MEANCDKCQDTGRIRSGPIPQRAQGYLETWCLCPVGKKAYEQYIELYNKYAAYWGADLIVAGH